MYKRGQYAPHRCIKCGNNFNIKCRTRKRYENYVCFGCTMADPDRRDNLSRKTKDQWQTTDIRAIHQESLDRLRNDPEYLTQSSERSKKLWNDPQYVAKMRSRWTRQEREKYRQNAIKSGINQSNRVSSIQEILYSILDDLNIKYYREYNDKQNDPETIVGPHSFDCMIPLEGRRDLLIECQGDYWHSLDKKVSTDAAKATYISTYHDDTYELKYIWEHEFHNYNKVVELIKYWTGTNSLEIIDFNFSDIEIKKCQPDEYKLLLSKYHYLPNAGRGGIAYGAYYNDELAAVCIFSPVPRQNITIDQYKHSEIRELSRLCIHPKYQKRNFASWLISRCIKSLDDKYKCIISYCDTTFNHNGAVYKACNFEQDAIVSPDYWYADNQGWVMHKKTLYNRAKSLCMKESEFASKHGYNKVYGKEKIRFVYRRK